MSLLFLAFFALINCFPLSSWAKDVTPAEKKLEEELLETELKEEGETPASPGDASASSETSPPAEEDGESSNEEDPTSPGPGGDGPLKPWCFDPTHKKIAENCEDAPRSTDPQCPAGTWFCLSYYIKAPRPICCPNPRPPR